MNEHSKTVVVGDSNTRHFTDVQADWQVDCLPGLDIKEAIATLRKMKLTDTLETIILHVGINDRNADFQSGLPQDFTNLVEHFQGKYKRILVTGIPCTHLPEAEQINIGRLNELFKWSMKDDFIPTLDEGDIRIKMTDPHQIHFTEKTASLLVKSMVNHLNQ